MRFTRVVALLLGLLALAGASAAQERLPIFDAHLHYNVEARTGPWPLPRVLDLFREQGIIGIIANSRPNEGTRALIDAKAPGLAVVAFIRPYRTRDDIQTWFKDPAIRQLIESEHAKGGYAGSASSTSTARMRATRAIAGSSTTRSATGSG